MMDLGKFRQFFIKTGFIPKAHSLIGYLKSATVSQRTITV